MMKAYSIRVGSNPEPIKMHASRFAVAVKYAIDRERELKKGQTMSISVTRLDIPEEVWDREKNQWVPKVPR